MNKNQRTTHGGPSLSSKSLTFRVTCQTTIVFIQIITKSKTYFEKLIFLIIFLNNKNNNDDDDDDGNDMMMMMNEWIQTDKSRYRQTDRSRYIQFQYLDL